MHLTPKITYADAVAQGVYVDSRHTASNFGKLRIVTLPGQPDTVQMAAAGYVEAWLTAGDTPTKPQLVNHDSLHYRRIHHHVFVNRSQA